MVNAKIYRASFSRGTGPAHSALYIGHVAHIDAYKRLTPMTRAIDLDLMAAAIDAIPGLEVTDLVSRAFIPQRELKFKESGATPGTGELKLQGFWQPGFFLPGHMNRIKLQVNESVQATHDSLISAIRSIDFI